MLVLSRKREEKILIGNEIVITVLQIQGDRIRLGIEAPKHVRVLRHEIVGKPLSAAADGTISADQVATDIVEVNTADVAAQSPMSTVQGTVVTAKQPQVAPLGARMMHRRMTGEQLQNLTAEPVDANGILARRAPRASVTTSNRFSQHLGPASLVQILNRLQDRQY